MENTVLIANESGLRIDTFEDVINAIGQCYCMDRLLLTETDLSPNFFDLSSGLAGELFQKCTNYRLQLAVVVKDLSIYSPRVAELTFEHQTHKSIRFFDTQEKALAWLD
ncbi:MAG: hypothetical protein RLZZ156_1963 [Deinococcota bacterium]|jgi:hypothetical protein